MRIRRWGIVCGIARLALGHRICGFVRLALGHRMRRGNKRREAIGRAQVFVHYCAFFAKVEFIT